jgi:menaquinone-dependent protoporphyrinogen oxidase
VKNRILVCYATKYGATEEIAREIGKTLHEAGLAVDVIPVIAVTDLKPYRAVIIGSPIYMGKWLHESAQFVRDHRVALSHREVAAFAVGYSLKDRLEEHLRNADRAIDAIRLYVEPVDVALFAGRIIPDTMSAADRAILTLGGVKPGDFRDWDEIRAWAGKLAERLGKQFRNSPGHDPGLS